MTDWIVCQESDEKKARKAGMDDFCTKQNLKLPNKNKLPSDFSWAIYLPWSRYEVGNTDKLT